MLLLSVSCFSTAPVLILTMFRVKRNPIVPVHMINDTSVIVITIQIAPSQSYESYFLSAMPAKYLI